MTTKLGSVGLVALGLSLLSPGCTATTPSPSPATSTAPSSGSPAASPGASQSVESVTVNIESYTFTPNSETVHPGATVTFVNQDSVPHTVSPEHGASFTGLVLSAGASGSVAFNATGEQDYYCQYHAGMAGMHAKVQVQ